MSKITPEEKARRKAEKMKKINEEQKEMNIPTVFIDEARERKGYQDGLISNMAGYYSGSDGDSANGGLEFGFSGTSRR